MSDFTAINPTPKDEGIIENNSFFPDIKLSELRAAQNLDATVTTQRLKKSVIDAISRTNQDLFEWQLKQKTNGYTSMDCIPSEKINNESLFIHQYKHAVYCLTNAFLIEKYRNFDATAQGIKKSEDVLETANDLYRETRYAIRDILGIPHSTFELV